MRRSIIGLLVLSTGAFGCGGGSGASTTSQAAVSTTGAVATTTTAPEATTTSAPPAAVFTAEDLPMAVLTDGDPWVVPIVGAQQFPLTLDDIWPIENFPEERPVYEGAGFQAGSFSAFIEEGALVITGAHLFADAAGASVALDLIESSFMDTELIAAITDLEPGALTAAESLESSVGDRSAAVLATGPDFQVVGVIWTQGNLLQFVRIGMVVGDDARQAATFDLAEAIAARVAGG
ncbi:MAG: hypothetical protein WD184_06565 [Acidimicrobiia bacterium]